MSADPVIRLAALHARDSDEAMALLFPAAKQSAAARRKLIADAVAALTEETQEAITFGRSEIVLGTEMAEVLAIALKSLVKAPHRPNHTKTERLRREALVAFGRQLKARHMASGMRAGEAECAAAVEIAELGRRLGDVASRETIQKLMRSRHEKQG